MISTVLLAIFVGVSVAQICTCYQDDEQGYWAGSDCSFCDPSKTDKTFDPADATEDSPCSGYAFCGPVNPARDPLEMSCYGQGTCGTPNSPCECFGNQGGQFCEICIPGKTGWPSCTTDECVEFQTCNGNGDCNGPASLTQSCGGQPYTQKGQTAAQDQKCETKTNPQTGELSYEVVLVKDYKTLCGGFVMCDWDEVCSADEKATTKLKGDEARMAAETPMCGAVGTTVCHNLDGSTGAFCRPSESCCDGTCCPSNQKCVMPKAAARVLWDQFNDPLIAPVATNIYASMKWKLPDQSSGKDLISKQCSATAHISAPSFVRVVILPVCLSLAVLICAGLVVGTTGLNPMSIGIPALMIVVSGLFLCWTNLWAFGLLACLSGFVALGSAHKGDSTVFAYGLLFQFFALAVICGGMGVGNLWVTAGQGLIPSSIAGSSNFNWNSLTDCSNYFDTYRYANNDITKPWKAAQGLIFYGVCSEGFYGIIFICSAVIVFSQAVCLVASGVAFLGGSKEMK